MNKVQFKTRKEVSAFLKEKNIDTSNWTEEKWQSINKSQAEIHIQALAEAMWDAYNESIPNQLEEGAWHIPDLGHKWDNTKLYELSDYKMGDDIHVINKAIEQTKIKIATTHCAKISYDNFGTKIDYEKDIKFHDKLLQDKHRSPFEHCARAMNDEEYDSFIKGRITLGLDTSTGGWGGPLNRTYHLSKNTRGWCNNFRGFRSYRQILEEC